jgi:hypothetical protein
MINKKKEQDPRADRHSPAPRRADLPAGEAAAEAGEEDLARRRREKMEEAALLAAMPDSFLTAKLRAAEDLKHKQSASRSAAAAGDYEYVSGKARQVCEAGGMGEQWPPLFSVALRFFWRGLYIGQVSSLECGGAW